jgi:cell envelope opacity-associated protein A
MVDSGELDAVRVEREETQVMFLRTEDEPEAMRKAWERL